MSYHPIAGYPEEEHTARLLLGDSKAEALKWIEGYAKNLSDMCEDEEYGNHPVTSDELIDTHLSHMDSNTRWGGDYIIRGGAFEGVGVDQGFFRAMNVLLNKDVDDESTHHHFFSCSC